MGSFVKSLIMAKFLQISTLAVLISTAIFDFIPARAATDFTYKTEIASTPLGANVQLVEYDTACPTGNDSGSDPNQGIIITRNAASQVREIYFYFPGNNASGVDREPEDVCYSNNTKLCDIVNNNQNLAIVAFNKSVSPRNTRQWLQEPEHMRCFINEAKNKLRELGVSSNRLNLAGHSGGGLQVLRATKNSGLSFSRGIFFDACYGTQCSDAAATGRTGDLFIYYRADSDTEQDSVNTKDGFADKVKLVQTTAAHGSIPQSCFLDHLDNSLCDGTGTEIGTPFAGEAPPTTEVSPAPAGSTPSDAAGTTDSYYSQSDIQELISAPQPIINIPGLQFSDADLSRLFTTDYDEFGRENTYYYFPFLGEYLAAAYRYAVGAAAILAIVIIIISGLQWAASAGNQETIGSAKKRIFGALIGLFLAVGSYTILYTINPELTEFASLKVLTIKGEAINLEGPSGDAEEEAARRLRREDTPLGTTVSGSRLFQPPNQDSFCFPVAKDGYVKNTNNWGQSRVKKTGERVRCHAGVDLLTDGTNNRGTVLSMTDGEVMLISRRFTECKDGRTEKTGPGTYEWVGAIYVYDRRNNFTYIYGEINNDTIKVKKGDMVKKGQTLGIASKCTMLHLEVYAGKGRKTGTSMYVSAFGKKKSGWYLFDELKEPLNLPDQLNQGRNICAQDPYLQILNKTGSTLLDPRQFLNNIKDNFCEPDKYYAPPADTDVELAIQQFSACHGIDWRVFRETAMAESSLRPHAKLGRYYGLFQESETYCKEGLRYGDYSIVGLSVDNCENGSADDLSGRFDIRTNVAAAAGYINFLLQRIDRKCPGISAYDGLTLMYIGHNNGIGVMTRIITNMNDDNVACNMSNIYRYTRDYYIERGGSAHGVTLQEAMRKYNHGKTYITDVLFGANKSAPLDVIFVGKNPQLCPD